MAAASSRCKQWRIRLRTASSSCTRIVRSTNGVAISQSAKHARLAILHTRRRSYRAMPFTIQHAVRRTSRPRHPRHHRAKSSASARGSGPIESALRLRLRRRSTPQCITVEGARCLTRCWRVGPTATKDVRTLACTNATAQAPAKATRSFAAAPRQCANPTRTETRPAMRICAGVNRCSDGSPAKCYPMRPLHRLRHRRRIIPGRNSVWSTPRRTPRRLWRHSTPSTHAPPFQSRCKAGHLSLWQYAGDTYLGTSAYATSLRQLPTPLWMVLRRASRHRMTERPRRISKRWASSRNRSRRGCPCLLVRISM